MKVKFHFTVCGLWASCCPKDELARYGRADLGLEGIKSFFESHQCGPTCEKLQLQEQTTELLRQLQLERDRRCQAGIIAAIQLVKPHRQWKPCIVMEDGVRTLETHSHRTDPTDFHLNCFSANVDQFCVYITLMMEEHKPVDRFAWTRPPRLLLGTVITLMRNYWYILDIVRWRNLLRAGCREVGSEWRALGVIRDLQGPLDYNFSLPVLSCLRFGLGTFQNAM